MVAPRFPPLSNPKLSSKPSVKPEPEKFYDAKQEPEKHEPKSPAGNEASKRKLKLLEVKVALKNLQLVPGIPTVVGRFGDAEELQQLKLNKYDQLVEAIDTLAFGSIKLDEWKSLSKSAKKFQKRIKTAFSNVANDEGTIKDWCGEVDDINDDIMTDLVEAGGNEVTLKKGLDVYLEHQKHLREDKHGGGMIQRVTGNTVDQMDGALQADNDVRGAMARFRQELGDNKFGGVGATGKVQAGNKLYAE